MRVHCPSCRKPTKVEEDLLDFLARCDYCYSFMELRALREAAGPGPAGYRAHRLKRVWSTTSGRKPTGIFDFPSRALGRQEALPEFSVDLDPPNKPTAREDTQASEVVWHPVRKWQSFHGPFCWASIGITVVLIALAGMTLFYNFDVLTAMPRHAQAANVGDVAPTAK